MKRYPFTPFVPAVLGLALAACGGGANDDQPAHTDTPSAVITGENALAIAADVYQVVAVDVPHTASIAMDPQDPSAVNTDACEDPTAIASGGFDMSMGMEMVFTNCRLTSSPTGHALTVNGRCSNSAANDTETVSGERIAFSASGETLALHNFEVTRRDDAMTRASGYLHLADDAVVRLSTPESFSGTAAAPLSGTLLVTGADAGRLRLEVTDGGAGFLVAVDADGDGSYETTLTGNWNNDFWLPLIP